MRGSLLKRLEELERLRRSGAEFVVVDQGACVSAEDFDRRTAEAEARVGPGGAVFVIRDLAQEQEHASGTADPAKASEGDRGGGAAPGAQPPTASATPGERVTDPTTKKRRNHG